MVHDRCKEKTESDYFKEDYPQSAHIIDIVRGSISFGRVSTFMSALNAFIDIIQQNKELFAQDKQLGSPRVFFRAFWR